MSKERKQFEKFYSYLKQTKDFDKKSLKELMWSVYCQACVDCGVNSTEISNNEVLKFIEDSMFIDFVHNCILNPSDKPLPQNDYVKVTYKCSPEDREKCIAWPDRCEDVGGDGDCCSTIINLSKLCGIESNKTENVNDKILTAEEVNELANAIANGNK